MATPRCSRYRMTREEIIEAARDAAALGYGTVVLQSGEDQYYAADLLAAVLRTIKAENDLAITLSIGERSEEEYARLRYAGADRFLLRIETSSPDLYRELHPDLGLAGAAGVPALPAAARLSGGLGGDDRTAGADA